MSTAHQPAKWPAASAVAFLALATPSLALPSTGTAPPTAPAFRAPAPASPALRTPAVPLAAPARTPAPLPQTTITQGAGPARIWAFGREWDEQGYLLLPDGRRQLNRGGYWRLYMAWPYFFVTGPANAGGITQQGYKRTETPPNDPGY